MAKRKVKGSTGTVGNVGGGAKGPLTRPGTVPPSRVPPSGTTRPIDPTFGFGQAMGDLYDIIKGAAGDKAPRLPSVYGPPAPKPKPGAKPPARGEYKGTAGYRPAITAPNGTITSKQATQQARADKKYGKGKYVAGSDGKLRPVRSSGGGGASGGSAPGGGKGRAPASAAPAANPKPDEIATMLAGMLSQSQRLTDFYGGQLKGISDQTVKDGLALAAAQGSLNTMAPTVYYAGDEGVAQQARAYTDLVNAAGQADTKARLAASQSSLAGTANAQQTYYNALRDNANLRHLEYGRSLQAMEPKLRADKAAAEAETALKQAEQQYLYDKLGVDSAYKQGQLDLGKGRLAETVRNNNLLDSSRRANLQLSLADKNVKNALAGSKVSASDRREINAWVRDHLYVKQTVEEMDKNGMPTGQSVSQLAPKPLAGNSVEQLGSIVKQMVAAGFAPDAAVRVAQEHARGSAAKMGAGRFFAVLVNAGVSPRQSIAQVSRVFGAAAARKVKRNKNEYLGVNEGIGSTFDKIIGAVPGGQ